MRQSILTVIMISIVLVIFTDIVIAENKIMIFSTHVREGTIVYKTTFSLMEEAFKRIGFGFVMKTYPGKRALSYSNEGKTDGEAHRIYGIIDRYPNLVRIPEIQQIIYNYAYATRDINLDNGWKDLAQYKVALQRGSIFLTEMSKKYAKDTDELSDTIQLFRYLKAGRGDLVLFTPAGAGIILKMEEFKNSKIKRIEPPLTALPIYAYLNKKHSELAPEVAKALFEMKMDGTYKKIINNVHTSK